MNTIKNLFQANGRNAERVTLFGGAVLLLISFALAFFFPALFFRAYLVAFVFWLGMALGCLAILMLHHLSGGAWGAVLLRILEAGARTLPWLTIIGLPLYLGIPTLFVWARPEGQADPLIQAKAAYLNVPFFVARTIAYFVIWNALVYVMNRWSRARDETGDVRYNDRLRRGGAIGLVIFGFTVTFAAIDWMMSLEPEWYSTIFGAMVAIGGVLACFAFVILTFTRLARKPPLSSVWSPQLLNDLGNLLLAFVMMWAYLAFSQYLLIWAGNLRQEVTWYVLRLNNGWQVLAVLIGVLYFALPFALLIIREVKRHAWLLGLVTLILVITRWVEVYWLIEPAFEPTLTLNVIAVVATMGMGGVWLALFARELGKRSLLAPSDKNLSAAEEWAQEGRAAPRRI
ncbi:MAG TPA: hypothetical protein VFD70_10520 [Anaerolineae bacterium]|nr:hypothetical protein [Anaerolineae bacterium]